MQRFGTRWARHGLDLLIALGAGVGVVEVIQRDDTGAPQWLAATFVLVVVLLLFARASFPFGAPVAVWLVASVFSFIDGTAIVSTFGIYATGLAAAFLLGNLSDRLQARVGLGVVLAGSAVIVFNNPAHVTGDYVFVPATFAIAWAAGSALRSRAAQAEAAEHRAAIAELQRDAAARIAVAEERARITRELHDIVAHAVSVMVLQVGAVRHKLPESLAEDKDALKTVEETGRAALSDMRRLLGAMPDGDGGAELSPQPGLDGLGALIEKVRLAGLEVRVQVEGVPFQLPRAVDLSAYRIVQEGLTNSLKHARATHAEVTVRYGEDGLQLEIRDDGVGSTPSDGLGRGLTGVRERVKIYGGEMSAGAAPDGGYVLTARLPTAVSPS